MSNQVQNETRAKKNCKYKYNSNLYQVEKEKKIGKIQKVVQKNALFRLLPCKLLCLYAVAAAAAADIALQ